MSDKKFTVHIPVELIKSKSEDDSEEWRVRGIASTDDEDLQGEIVDQNGVDISVLKAGRGLFNWDHQKGPENILGQIEKADFVEHNDKRALMVEGYLFKHQDRAKAFYNILRSVKKSSGPRVHMSIEGKILERDIRNPRSINKARVEKVALTLDPVNPYTFTELVKSLNAEPENSETFVQVPEIKEETLEISQSDLEILIETAEKALVQEGKAGPTQPEHDLYEKAAVKGEVKIVDHSKLADKMRHEHEKIEDVITEGAKNSTKKALSAGAGGTKAPEDMSSGESSTKESLESRIKRITYGKKQKKNKKEMVKSVLDRAIQLYPDHDPIELTEWILEAALRKK